MGWPRRHPHRAGVMGWPRRHPHRVGEMGWPREMAQAAVRAALAVGYEGAGTFEFLLDPDGRYYVMEVNCRIQVDTRSPRWLPGSTWSPNTCGRRQGTRWITQSDVVRRGVARSNAASTPRTPPRNFVPTPGVLTEFDTTARFLSELVNHPLFRTAKHSTTLVDDIFSPGSA